MSTDIDAGLYRACKVAVPAMAALGIWAYNQNQPSGNRLAPWRFDNKSLVAQRREVPVETVMATGVARLRARSRWTNALSSALGFDKGKLGAFFAGRWKPDLIDKVGYDARSFLAALIKDGATVLGGGWLINHSQTGEEEEVEKTFFVRIRLGPQEHVICPDLLARLSQYSCFRKRDASLVAALRARALEFLRERRVDDWGASLVMPSTVALAALESSPEAAASELLDSRAMHCGARWGAYVVHSGERGWWKNRG